MISEGKYTESVHAMRLMVVLESEKPCKGCPATFNFSGAVNPDSDWYYGERPCHVCQDFLGLSVRIFGRRCPCHRLTPDEVMKNSWLALEEKGYV
jgi:hypothetical protein